MIRIADLTESDVGRDVVYQSRKGALSEFGVISSWNARFVFVRYAGAQQSQATDPNYLQFAKE